MLLRVFIRETDRWKHQPLYEAIVLKARGLHLAGATVLRGPMGYGKSSRLHTAKILRLSSDLPLVIEIIWFIAAFWMGLAFVASLISIRLGISVALIEILVGLVAAEHGIRIACETRRGHPAKNIVQAAADKGCDLIVVGHSDHSEMWGQTRRCGLLTLCIA